MISNPYVKYFIVFVFKFLAVYFLCYYGTLFMIGISAPGGIYSQFVHDYFDFVRWIRISLVSGTKFFLSWFQIDTYQNGEFNIRKVGGRGVIVGYQCVGYAILSFWTAFLVASPGGWKKKLLWWLLGFIFFWILNVLRMSVLLIATNEGWSFPFGWDHHTWFNIITYAVMLLSIYFFNRKNTFFNNKITNQVQ